jgi:hypothetical protein|tara:strand:- start:73 stop:618 length:546 start_codon:yes stop_codon:yes gene_type:complete
MADKAPVPAAPMTGGTPVKRQEQTIFMYRLRIYTGIHACVEVANLAVGFVMSQWLSALFVWLVIPAAMALVVTVNFTGQFFCTPRGYWTRTGALLNALFMLIAACLSVYGVIFYTFVTAWCNATDTTYKIDHKELCDSVTMGFMFGMIGMIFKIITFLLMFPFCCCGWKGLKPMPGSAGYV